MILQWSNVKIFETEEGRVALMANKTFQKALEIVESLPGEQRESLMDIVRRRLIEERRDRLAQSIEEAREEYKHGRVRKGNVDDFMHELSK